MKKVQNVIKGYSNQFDIKEITVFDTDETVIYSGSFEKFMSTSEEDGFLWEEWKRILNSDCEKCIPFNHSKLFIFLYHHSCFDCGNKTDTGYCKFGHLYNCKGKQWEKKTKGD